MTTRIVTRDVEHPVGEWKFTVEQTGVTLKSASAATLQRATLNHFRANDIPLPQGSFKEWFEDAMCRQQGYGDPFCGDAPKKLPKQASSVTWRQLESFTKTMWGLVAGGLKLVDQAEADRRAAICAACPLNQEFGVGCQGCKTFLRRAAEALGSRVTGSDADLKDCLACGCVLKLKVWIPQDTLDKAEAGNTPEYDPACWRINRQG